MQRQDFFVLLLQLLKHPMNEKDCNDYRVCSCNNAADLLQEKGSPIDDLNRLSNSVAENQVYDFVGKYKKAGTICMMAQ